MYILLCSRLWVHLPYFLHGESATTVPSTTRPQWVASFSGVFMKWIFPFSQHYVGLYVVSVNSDCVSLYVVSVSSVSVFMLFQSTLTVSVFMLFQSTLCQSLCCFSQLTVSVFMLFQSTLCHTLCCFNQLYVSLLCCFSQLYVSFMLFQSTLTVSVFMLFQSTVCQALCCDDIYAVCFALFANVVLVIWNWVTFVFCSEAATSRNRSEQRRWHCVRRICQGENHLC